MAVAMNARKCGHLGDESGLCNGATEQVSRYRGRISGPLLDRIDLHVEMSHPTSFLLQHEGPRPESSREVRERVIAARDIQLERAGQSQLQRHA